MRKQKLLLCGFITLCICLTTACKGGGSEQEEIKEPVDDTPVVKTVDTEYADLDVSPDYPQILDMSKYTTYYFDSQSGSDMNDGLSESAPMNSLDSLNELIAEIKAEEPVRILIKAGSEYSGTMKVSGFEAAEETPLIIDVYGESDEKRYAKIIGPEKGSCVVVENGNVRISGLETTGENAYRGIYICPVREGAMENVVIAGNYCHDLNFRLSEVSEGLPEVGTAPTVSMIMKICWQEVYSYQNGGIIAETATPEFLGASWFENFWIEDNIVERVARTGIWVFSEWTYRPGCDWGNNHYYSDEVNYYPHHNVVIRNNHISYAGGDGIVMGAVHGGWIEKNTSMYANYLGRAGYANVGIWTHSCKDIVFQYNEAGYTYMDNGSGDGEGFDVDIGCSDILFRYNYSHHNKGGGILLCNKSTWCVLYDENGDYIRDEDGLPTRKRIAPDWKNVTMSNNVFADNAGPVTVMAGYVSDLTFANNTVVIPGGTSNYKIVDSWDLSSTGIVGSGWNFYNNIFISCGGESAKFDFSFCDGYSVDTNVCWGFPEDFEKTLQEELGENMKNLLIQDPGISLEEDSQTGWSAMTAFKPAKEAMLMEAKPLEEMNKFDAEGTEVVDIRYFGAFGTSK